MRQGTISVLFGCHSFIHSILVAVSWKILYGQRPKLWELVCIFLHDIGHIKLNYLDDLNQKEEHWILGAGIAQILFGRKGLELVAGHCHYSGFSESNLYKADKYSWYIAPYWWLCWNNLVEPKLLGRFKNNKEAIIEFKKQIKDSIENERFVPTHNFHLSRIK